MSTAFVVFSLVENVLAVKSRWPVLLVYEQPDFCALSDQTCRLSGQMSERARFGPRAFSASFLSLVHAVGK